MEPGSTPSQTSFKGWEGVSKGVLLGNSAYLRSSKGKQLLSLFVFFFFFFFFVSPAAAFGLILTCCSLGISYPAITAVLFIAL